MLQLRHFKPRATDSACAVPPDSDEEYNEVAKYEEGDTVIRYKPIKAVGAK